jgi:hypothetical protein
MISTQWRGRLEEHTARPVECGLPDWRRPLDDRTSRWRGAEPSGAGTVVWGFSIALDDKRRLP